MADIANLGLGVDSSQVERGTVTLNQLTGAAGTAERAVRGLAGAGQAEAAGMKVATAATQAHTAALNANNASMRAGAAQRTNLIFQLNDVGVSLASGMNPLMVLAQQGSQIATIYKGGVVEALKESAKWAGELVIRFWPIAAAVGLVSAAIAGLTYEINKTADIQVGFFDVALAGWQLFAEGVASLVAPVFGQLGAWLQQGWDIAAPILKSIGNAIIGTFVAAFDAISAVWSNLPAALGDWAYQGAQAVLDAFTIMGQQAVASLNGLLMSINDKFGAMGVNLPTLGEPYKAVPGAVLDNPFAGAGSKLTSGVTDAVGGAYGKDYLGDAYGAISDRAQQIAAAKAALDEVGGAASAANDNVKKLADDGLSAAAKAAKEFGDTIKDAFKGFIDDLRDGKSWTEALGNALGNLGDRFLDLALDAVFGGGGAGGGGGLFGMIAGLFGFADGGVFSAGHQVQAFAKGGIVNKPTLFPMANGAGLMGEAGPEAVMPLRRGPDGRLGVSAANQNSTQQAVHVTVGVAADGNGNIMPFVQSVAQSTVGKAAPAIVSTSVSQANKSAPAALARYQQQEQGSDYRVG